MPPSASRWWFWGVVWMFLGSRASCWGVGLVPWQEATFPSPHQPLQLGENHQPDSGSFAVYTGFKQSAPNKYKPALLLLMWNDSVHTEVNCSPGYKTSLDTQMHEHMTPHRGAGLKHSPVSDGNNAIKTYPRKHLYHTVYHIIWYIWYIGSMGSIVLNLNLLRFT